MTVWEAINSRKSVRSYLDKEIPEEDLRKVLEAGRLAPSAQNEQNWTFLVITDKDLNLQLRDACAGHSMVGEAPVSIIVLGEGKRIMQIGKDSTTVNCSIAMTHIILQAEELGLSTCWLGRVYANQVKNLFNIPDKYDVIAVTPLGYAAEPGNEKSRKPFDEVVKFNKL